MNEMKYECDKCIDNVNEEDEKYLKFECGVSFLSKSFTTWK